ncbi:hypothetical protein ABK040_011146 [Willaertia magna]
MSFLSSFPNPIKDPSILNISTANDNQQPINLNVKKLEGSPSITLTDSSNNSTKLVHFPSQHQNFKYPIHVEQSTNIINSNFDNSPSLPSTSTNRPFWNFSSFASSNVNIINGNGDNVVTEENQSTILNQLVQSGSNHQMNRYQYHPLPSQLDNMSILRQLSPPSLEKNNNENLEILRNNTKTCSSSSNSSSTNNSNFLKSQLSSSPPPFHFPNTNTHSILNGATVTIQNNESNKHSFTPSVSHYSKTNNLPKSIPSNSNNSQINSINCTNAINNSSKSIEEELYEILSQKVFEILLEEQIPPKPQEDDTINSKRVKRKQHLKEEWNLFMKEHFFKASNNSNSFESSSTSLIQFLFCLFQMIKEPEVTILEEDIKVLSVNNDNKEKGILYESEERYLASVKFKVNLKLLRLKFCILFLLSKTMMWNKTKKIKENSTVLDVKSQELYSNIRRKGLANYNENSMDIEDENQEDEEEEEVNEEINPLENFMNDHFIEMNENIIENLTIEQFIKEMEFFEKNLRFKINIKEEEEEQEQQRNEELDDITIEEESNEEELKMNISNNTMNHFQILSLTSENQLIASFDSILISPNPNTSFRSSSSSFRLVLEIQMNNYLTILKEFQTIFNLKKKEISLQNPLQIIQQQLLDKSTTIATTINTLQPIINLQKLKQQLLQPYKMITIELSFNLNRDFFITPNREKYEIYFTIEFKKKFGKLKNIFIDKFIVEYEINKDFLLSSNNENNLIDYITIYRNNKKEILCENMEINISLIELKNTLYSIINHNNTTHNNTENNFANSSNNNNTNTSSHSTNNVSNATTIPSPTTATLVTLNNSSPSIITTTTNRSLSPLLLNNNSTMVVNSNNLTPLTSDVFTNNNNLKRNQDYNNNIELEKNKKKQKKNDNNSLQKRKKKKINNQQQTKKRFKNLFLFLQNLQDICGFSLLHFSTFFNFFNFTKFLLQKLNFLIDKKDNFNYTCFHWSCFNNFFNLTIFLLKSGANLTLQNIHGMNATEIISKFRQNFMLLERVEKFCMKQACFTLFQLNHNNENLNNNDSTVVNSGNNNTMNINGINKESIVVSDVNQKEQRSGGSSSVNDNSLNNNLSINNTTLKESESAVGTTSQPATTTTIITTGNNSIITMPTNIMQTNSSLSNNNTMINNLMNNNRTKKKNSNINSSINSNRSNNSSTNITLLKKITSNNSISSINSNSNSNTSTVTTSVSSINMNNNQQQQQIVSHHIIPLQMNNLKIQKGTKLKELNNSSIASTSTTFIESNNTKLNNSSPTTSVIDSSPTNLSSNTTTSSSNNNSPTTNGSLINYNVMNNNSTYAMELFIKPSRKKRTYISFFPKELCSSPYKYDILLRIPLKYTNQFNENQFSFHLMIQQGGNNQSQQGSASQGGSNNNQVTSENTTPTTIADDSNQQWTCVSQAVEVVKYLRTMFPVNYREIEWRLMYKVCSFHYGRKPFKLRVVYNGNNADVPQTNSTNNNNNQTNNNDAKITLPDNCVVYESEEFHIVARKKKENDFFQHEFLNSNEFITIDRSEHR